MKMTSFYHRNGVKGRPTITGLSFGRFPGSLRPASRRSLGEGQDRDEKGCMLGKVGMTPRRYIPVRHTWEQVWPAWVWPLQGRRI